MPSHPTVVGALVDNLSHRVRGDCAFDKMSAGLRTARTCKEGQGKCAVGSPPNPFDAGATANAGRPNLGGYPNAAPGASPGASRGASRGVAPLTIAKPPTGLLAVGGVIALVGAVLAAICWASGIALIGWTLAGPVAIGVMALYVARDTALHAEPIYLRPEWLTKAYAAVATLAVIGIVVSSLSVAFWVGRL